ncbi:MAG: sensor histidine kinase, partial [Bacteroidota bacterium]
GFLFFVYRSRKRINQEKEKTEEANVELREQKEIVEQANQELSEQKNKISKQNELLDTLIKDHHHRLKNQYQFFINLVERGIISGEISEEVADKYQNRMMVMGSIEDLLAKHDYQSEDNAQGLSFRSILELFAGYLVENDFREEGELAISSEVPNLYISIRTTDRLMLIISELTFNSIKHNPEIESLQIHIAMKARDNGYFDLIFRDNGRGLPEEMPKKPSSMGMQLVDSLVKNLTDSKMSTRNDAGAVYTFTFTDKQEKTNG